MLSQLIGPVDINAAFVLVAITVALCIVITSLIVKRRSRQDISNEFELARMKEEATAASQRYRDETTRSVEFKKIDQNLITSHRADD